ncbi:MAG TPA: hypothetical protein PKD59_14130 [Miltoncostaeaceae bacterium]|nr:hypothetical protein [Miltoncostaeaceae bacterium]
MNAAGTAVVAWWESGVMAVRRAPGGALAAPVPLSQPGGAGPSPAPPVLAVSASGRVVAAWRRVADGRARVEGAAGAPDGTWSRAILSPAAARSAGRPALAGNADGAAIVAWSQPAGRSLATIRARVFLSGLRTFGDVETLSGPRGRGTAPAVGIDAAGRAVAAWRSDPLGGPGRSFRGAIRRAIP